MADEQNSTLLNALLGAIEEEIIPRTTLGVEQGNKIFGAALLKKADYSVVLAETNNEIENPLWHGEVHTLKRFYELPAEMRPSPSELIFLSTHEPCSMCLSAITWSGFDNFYYFFSHEDSRDAFAIPHDLRILKEVFTLRPGGYRRANAFWRSHSIKEMVQSAPSPLRRQLDARASMISRRYAELSEKYQRAKDGNSIPLR
ncbi:nucleoside deaminase [Neorhizobium sp. DT-125]|uniref:nucleoside deaminase n=1 Tax=Neorhizobium sp. DT-125 TaxID=3396163 RepID=UPI003F1B0FF0